MIFRKPSLFTKKVPSTQWVVIASFLLTFAVGALLLAMPVSRVAGTWGRPLESLFLSISATCVTGLSPIVELTKVFSPFGLGVILLLVQIGALGIMTIGTFIIEVVGRRASMREEQMLMDSLGERSGDRIRSLLLGAVVFTAFWEAVGTLVLSLRLHIVYGYSAHRALGYGFFHAVTGFCNAGLSLYPDSLRRFAADPVMLLTFAALILIGGIGFIVHRNLLSLRPWRRDRLHRGRLTLHSRVVLVGALVTVVLGWLLNWICERNGAFAGLSSGQQVLDAFFKAVTTRTCGFTATDEMTFGGFSQYFSMLVMLIGGAPGSTAGGLKVTTAVVLLATVSSMIHNREECELWHRTIPARVVRESIAILMLGATAVFTATFLLHLFEAGSPVFFPGHDRGLSIRLVYEAVSAFGTVGLSLDTTPNLTVPSQICLLVCMFIGRLGPLTLAMTMSGAAPRRPRRYPEEGIVVG